VRPLVAQATVPRPREEIFAVLADLPGHWRLAGRWIQAVELNHGGGVVRVRGPLGLSRTARTTVLRTEAPRLVAGEARLGHTRAAVTWLLEHDGAGTRVTLRADVLSATAADRVLLALGGRWWLTRHFAATLQRLG
jgi:hypothetical protein